MQRAILVIALVCACGDAAAANDCTLIFDAVAHEWSQSPACESRRMPVDLNGVPTLYIRQDDAIEVRITNINPLQYVATFGEVTVADIPQVKDLATLFLQFGGLLQLVGKRTVPGPGLKPALEAVQALMTTFSREEAAIVGAAQQLEVSAPSEPFQRWLDALRDLRARYDESPGSDESRKAAAAILEKERDLLKAVATAKVIAQRACLAASAATARCSGDAARTYTVPREIRLGLVSRDTRWSKVATFPVSIKRRPAYESLVSLMPSEIATSFKLTSRQASLLGIGFGLVGSNIVSPAWKAVADPANPAQKVVTRTSEQNRGSVKSLIATWAFTDATAASAFRPVMEFGASLESDKPGAIVGGGFAIARFVRVGLGLTAQRVHKLDGQREGRTIVADNDAIKTRDGWQGGWYWSFGLSITDLPLFSK